MSLTTIEGLRYSPTIEWESVLADISKENLYNCLLRANPDCHAKIALREVPEEYTDNIPSFIFYINHCGVTRKLPLHGDMQLWATHEDVFDDPDIQHLLNSFGASTMSYKRNVHSYEPFLTTQMPPFPLFLVPDVHLLQEMCEDLSIPWNDFNIYIDPYNREKLYTFLHAVYDGGVPETDSRLGYAAVGKPSRDYYPYTRFNNKLKKAKRILRPTLGQRAKNIDSVKAYSVEKDVQSWVNQLAPATVEFTGKVEYLEYEGSDPVSYYEFLQHAREVFPGHDFGDLDPEASGLNKMHLQGAEFKTDSGISCQIYFSSSSGVCQNHREAMGLYDNM